MLVIHSMDEVMALIKQRLGNVLCVNPEKIDVQFGYIKGEPSVVTGLNETVEEDIFDEEEFVATASIKVSGSTDPDPQTDGETKPPKRRKRRTRAEIEADEAKQAAEATKPSEEVESAKPEGSDTQQPETKPDDKAPELESQPQASVDPEKEDKPPFKVDDEQPTENLFADDPADAGTVVDTAGAAEPATVVDDNPFASEPEPTVAAQNPFASESDNLFEEVEEVKPTTETSSTGFSKPAGTSGDEVLDLFA